ncbi:MULTISPECIES: hypothetical protein [unclassified Paraburkholderia]|nr:MULTISPECIES: hypothetical protein [unclassified Paraburkholderia]
MNLREYPQENEEMFKRVLMHTARFDKRRIAADTLKYPERRSSI